MDVIRKMLLFILILVVITSCTPWRKKYLEGGLNQLTMDEVSKTLGPPDFAYTLDDGGVVWKYRYMSTSVSGTKYRVSGGSDCTEYILIFDKDKVLRQTKRQGC
jgi:hypothetical protein